MAHGGQRNKAGSISCSHRVQSARAESGIEWSNLNQSQLRWSQASGSLRQHRVPLTEASYQPACVQNCQSGRVWSYLVCFANYVLNGSTDWPVLDNSTNRSNGISCDTMHLIVFAFAIRLPIGSSRLQSRFIKEPETRHASGVMCDGAMCAE